MNSIKSSLYKFIKTKGYLIHILVPLLGVLVFAGYYSISGMEEATKVCLYLEVIGIMMPVAISVVVTKQYDEESKAGAFQNILVYPGSRIASHAINLLILLIWGFIAVTIAVVGFGFFMNMTGASLFGQGFYIKASIIIFLTNLAWYFIVYIICYSLENGVSLALGVIGTIMAALMRVGLSLGDMIWQYIPSCYSTRIIMSLVKLNATTFYNEAEYVKATLENGIITVYIMTGVSFIVYLVWCNIWQGSKYSE